MARSIAAFALCVTLATSACGTAAPDEAAPELTERGTFRIEITHEAGDFRRGVNRFHVRAWNASNGAAATLAEVVAEMPSHDHARAVATVTSEGEGFTVDDLRLTMPGRWQINLRVAEGARTDVALVSVFIP